MKSVTTSTSTVVSTTSTSVFESALDSLKAIGSFENNSSIFTTNAGLPVFMTGDGKNLFASSFLTPRQFYILDIAPALCMYAENYDQDVIYVRPSFIEELKDFRVLSFVILHEEGHIICEHTRNFDGIRRDRMELDADLYALKNSSLETILAVISYFENDTPSSDETCLRIEQMRGYVLSLDNITV